MGQTMKRLDARKRAIARQSTEMRARRRHIRRGLVEVGAVARRVASKPSTLAAAGLCGAFVGYLLSGPAHSQSTRRTKGHQADRKTLTGSALHAVMRLVTLIPTGLALLSTLSGDMSRDQAAQETGLQASGSGSGDAC